MTFHHLSLFLVSEGYSSVKDDSFSVNLGVFERKNRKGFNS